MAWDLDRADWRTFRVDRMALRTPNGPRLTPRELPVGTWPRSWSGGSANGDWSCPGTVLLDLPAATVALYSH
ncbi:DeoR family transcriptional regulator [Actinoplanes sp. N902-109]|uniref:WYL domain-containing protein n=1 Tax=Actinoplanes sp. (strain N902-109) TaxID=649831 RepID=UPI0003294367|nr:DeoR family transcriptional regulator [Actinoplanes sp. N902-109]AGL14044.1 DeoR family transcriptional regulator [Actinoplanes sp. N902-109]